MLNSELVSLIKSRYPTWKVWDGYVPDMYGGVMVQTPTAKFEVRDVGDHRVIIDHKKDTDLAALRQLIFFLEQYYDKVETNVTKVI